MREQLTTLSWVVFGDACKAVGASSGVRSVWLPSGYENMYVTERVCQGHRQGYVLIH